MRRGECEGGARPCSLSTCAWNTASLKGGYMTPAPGGCVLDVADQNGATLEQVAELLGCSRERVRQIEAKALKRLRPHGAVLAGLLSQRRE